jgi:SagB-type dehydrogenase family enzyme
MSAAANPRDMSSAEAIRARRSVRRYAARPIDLSRLSRLLEAGQGITGADGKRATPSAHGLYPLALFVVAGNVDGLASGLHSYDPGSDPGSDPGAKALARLAAGDLRAGLRAAALEDQPWLAEAPAALVVAADMARARAAFAAQPPAGRRGARYVYLEAGALVQNVCLQATALGLATVFVGGFDDAKMAAALDLPEPFAPVGLICVGWPADPA